MFDFVIWQNVDLKIACNLAIWKDLLFIEVFITILSPLKINWSYNYNEQHHLFQSIFIMYMFKYTILPPSGFLKTVADFVNNNVHCISSQNVCKFHGELG